ncbi:MAG: metallophosphoesterase [Deltaproteobacteria bacterium]|jgi:predicted phosphodiesterase|nr:metallophosphoesterase [Deltaproteobacteria bacterium]MBW2530227.1 metallophosphoesterase [Deltaproteobacteria bacterium]
MSDDADRLCTALLTSLCSRRCALRLVLYGLGAGALVRCAPPLEPDVPPQLSRRRGLQATDATFFVAADTHLGAAGMAAANRRQVEAMNALPGTRWPARSAGRVAVPRGVIVLGDLTESGSFDQWRQFVALYGHTGTEGLLRFPVWLCTGNHDRSMLAAHGVLDQVRLRHGALRYGFALDDVRFLCLDQYPGERGRRWLARQLERVGPEAPVVLFFHYPLSGMLAGGWRPEDKEQLALTIVRFNVLAIFHGHFHKSERYRWQRHDVYNPGSPKHRWHSFLAVRITDQHMIVASWDWDRRSWAWFHYQPLRPTEAGRGASVRAIRPAS